MVRQGRKEMQAEAKKLWESQPPDPPPKPHPSNAPHAANGVTPCHHHNFLLLGIGEGSGTSGPEARRIGSKTLLAPMLARRT